MNHLSLITRNNTWETKNEDSEDSEEQREHVGWHDGYW